MNLKTNYSLSEIAFSIYNYSGIKRKNDIKIITNIIGNPENKNKYITTFNDDASAINIYDEDLLLFATDGIWEELVNKNPWWAGYAAVLSNINDIYAMGGEPIAMVDVLASNNIKNIEKICKGMKKCSNQFNVPIVGGHTHPDSSISSISVSIIGKVNKKSIIRSDTAKDGQIIIEAIDLDGKIGPNSNYSWVSTIDKSNSELNKLYSSIQKISNDNFVSSGKDISNPGIIGTIGMLCEYSNVGSIIDIDKILIPNNADIDIINWLKIHPSSGFIFTLDNKFKKQTINILNEAGFSTSVIGIIDSTKIVKLKKENQIINLFDFNKEKLF